MRKRKGSPPKREGEDVSKHAKISDKKKKKKKKAKKKKTRAILASGDSQRDALLRLYGRDAQPCFEVKDPHYVMKMKDLQNLIRWLVADGMNPSWIFVKHKPLINGVIVLHVPGLCQECWDRICTLSKSHAEMWHSIPTQIPGSNTRVFEPVSALLSVRSSRSRSLPVDEMIGQFIAMWNDATSRQCIDAFLLSQEEMVEHEYPLEGKSTEKEDSRGAFKSTRMVATIHTMVAIDCEMVRTSRGMELARCSMVSHVHGKNEVVYDTYVVPENPVEDYLTPYSGITKETLVGVTTRLSDVQAFVLANVCARSTTLVGHSLENDLCALRIVHKRVMDTAVVYASAGGRKHALKFLAANHLHMTIQSGGASGHDSVEDATAALLLAQMAIVKQRVDPVGGASLFSVLEKHNVRATIIGGVRMAQTYATSSTSIRAAASDPEARRALLQEVRSPACADVVWAQLDGAFRRDAPEDDEQRLKEFTRFIDALVGEMRTHQSLMVVPDHGPLAILNDLRSLKEHLPHDQWIAEMHSAVSDARRATSLLYIKPRDDK